MMTGEAKVIFKKKEKKEKRKKRIMWVWVI